MVRTSAELRLVPSTWFPDTIDVDQHDPQSLIRLLLKKYKALPGHQTADYLRFLGEAFGTGRAPVSLAEEMWMTWDMVREMQTGGMNFGAHTVNHPILARMTPAQQEFEVSQSCRRVSLETGSPVIAFSYPVGGQTARNNVTREALQRANVTWAFAYSGGFQSFGSVQPLDLPRVAVELDVTDSRFEAIAALPQIFA
jgi:hypothetical protein